MTTITQQKTPAGSFLNRYVSAFIHRDVAVAPSDRVTKKIVPPNHLTSLDFFFGHPFKTIDLCSGLEIPYKTTAIRGCRTTAKYAVEFNQPFSSFSVKFTSTGLYELTGLNMEKLTDADIGCNQLKLPFNIESLYQQLGQAAHQDERVAIMENTFRDVLGMRSPKSRLSGFFVNSEEAVTNEVFLSERQKQRLFKQEIGLNPKAFCNLRRFSGLLRAKKQNQQLSWTSLAHEFGYFDQAHLIKAFYSFLGMAPSLFNIENFAL